MHWLAERPSQGLPPRAPCHVHICVVSPQFIEHLLKSPHLGGVAFCPHDPTKVVVALVPWPQIKRPFQPFSFKSLRDKFWHRIGRSFHERGLSCTPCNQLINACFGGSARERAETDHGKRNEEEYDRDYDPDTGVRTDH